MDVRKTAGGSFLNRIFVFLATVLSVISGLEAALAVDIQEPGLLKPERIRIYNASADLSAKDLEDIKSRLGCIFSAEIEVLDSPALRIGPKKPLAQGAYNKGRGQYHVDWLLKDLVNVLGTSDSRTTFEFVVVDADLYGEPYNFLFGMSYLGTHIGVYSTYRLSQPSERVVGRLVKLLAKNTAKMAGLTKSELCVMRWPDSIVDLDSIPNDFCEPDVTALNTAGILGFCTIPIAQNGSRKRSLLLS